MRRGRPPRPLSGPLEGSTPQRQLGHVDPVALVARVDPGRLLGEELGPVEIVLQLGGAGLLPDLARTRGHRLPAGLIGERADVAHAGVERARGVEVARSVLEALLRQRAATPVREFPGTHHPRHERVGASDAGTPFPGPVVVLDLARGDPGHLLGRRGGPGVLGTGDLAGEGVTGLGEALEDPRQPLAVGAELPASEAVRVEDLRPIQVGLPHPVGRRVPGETEHLPVGPARHGAREE